MNLESQSSDAQNLALARAELSTLYAALDNVENALLILDRDLKAVYSNPRLHEIFKSYSPEELRSHQITYEQMLNAAQAAAAIGMPDYVAKRLAWVTSPNPKPMDLTMSNGMITRCQVALLPNGGRMLIYSDITDIVEHSKVLERLATTDELTGCNNRRQFYAVAETEWQRACRYQRPISLVILDIDRFKSVNDTYGHHAGDRVISEIAGVISSTKRSQDIMGRIGGEEFALMLPETDLAQGHRAAERIRHAVGSTRIACGDVELSTSISLGVAANDSGAENVSELMNYADNALYEAKRLGRNRVKSCVASARQRSPVLAD